MSSLFISIFFFIYISCSQSYKEKILDIDKKRNHIHWGQNFISECNALLPNPCPSDRQPKDYPIYTPQCVLHCSLNVIEYKIHQIHLLSGFVFDSRNNWKWVMAPLSQPSSLGRVRLLFTTLTVAPWVMYVLTLCNILSGSWCK